MSTAPTTVKALGFLKEKAAGDAAGPPVFRLSSGVLDRHRDRVRPDSVSVEEFDLNPVLLWNHLDEKPAIGTAKVYRDGDEWLMEPHFDRIGDLSKEIADKVEAKTLRTCSFKFIIDAAEPNAEGGLDYSAVRVVEVSITNVPANQESIRLKNAAPPPPPETPPTPATSKALEQSDLDALSALIKEELKPIQDVLAKLLEAAQVDAAEDVTEEPPPVEQPKGADVPPEDMSAKHFNAMLSGHRPR